MRDLSWLIALLLILIESICIIKCKKDSDHEDDDGQVSKQLEDICANRQVPISKVEDVKRMIRELRKHSDVCPESYKQSFYELDPILKTSQKFTICSDKRFKQISEYHFRYVNPKVEVYRPGQDGLRDLKKKVKRRQLDSAKVDYSVQLDEYDQEIMIPIALQQFFKAWALQVSGICKQMLVDNLSRAVQSNMDDDDLELIETFVETEKTATNPLTNMPLDDLSFFSLVYMPNLEDAIEGEDDSLYLKTSYLNLTSYPQLNRFMHNCKTRYKPIYSKLILPVVRLAKLGYDYMGPKITDLADKLKTDTEILTWLALTNICESQGKFELIEQKDSPLETEPVEYSPIISYKVEGKLWIKNADALQKEFTRIKGMRSKGLNKVWFLAEVGGRKIVAKLDPHQSKFYRRNQDTISSVLNGISITANAAAILVSFLLAG